VPITRSSRRLATAGLAAAAGLALVVSQTGTARAAAQAADPPTITFAASGPEAITADTPADGEVTVTNPGSTAIDDVRLDFDIIGFTVLKPADLSITATTEAPDARAAEDGTLPITAGQTNADVVAEYPSSTGFTLPTGTTTIDFEVDTPTGSALRGPLQFTAALDAVTSSGTVTSTLAEDDVDGPLLTAPKDTPYPVAQDVVLNRSSSITSYYATKNANSGGNPLAVTWGRTTDVRLTGDPLGTGDDVPMLYRPSLADFYTADESELHGSTLQVTGAVATHYGRVGDVPLVGNFNPDPTFGGDDEFAVYRPSNQDFYIDNGGTSGFHFGRAGDIPLVGNWTGSSSGDTFGVFRPSNATFYLLTVSGTTITENFGRGTDAPIVGDWTGSGTTLIGVHRSNTFYLAASNTSQAGVTSFSVGKPTDTITAATVLTTTDLLALADNSVVTASERQAQRAAAARIAIRP
jgi:hypothetical protein